MRCVGRREGEEVKEILGGRMKSYRRQFLGRKMHTRSCVRLMLRRIRGDNEA